MTCIRKTRVSAQTKKFTMHYWFIPKNQLFEKGYQDGKKKIYYISAEFLIGKLLSNNLINLGIYDDVAAFLKENGKAIADIEEVEPEPSLWKWWSWTSGSMLPGLHRNSRSSGRRYWSELSSGSFQTALWRQTSERNSEPMDWGTQLAHTCRCFLYCTVPRILTEIFPVRYRRCRIQ